MKRILPIILITVLTLCALSLTWAEPVKLEYKFTKGEVDKYKMTMDMNMKMSGLPDTAVPPMNMSMTINMQQRVLDVLEDGSAKVRLYTETPKMTGLPQGAAPKGPQSSTLIMTLAKDGRVLNVQGMDKALAGSGLSPEFMNQMMNQVGRQAIFPAEPVDVGATWNQAVPFPMGGGQMNVTSVLESTSESIWGQKAAKIRQNYGASIDISQMMKAVAGAMGGGNKSSEAAAVVSALTGTLNLSGGMDFFFAPALGKMLKGNGIMTATTTVNLPADAVKQGAPSCIQMVMDMNMNITRVR